MDRATLIAGLKARPTTFEVDGTPVPLRRLSAGERVTLLAWHRENRDVPDAKLVLMHKLVALGVADAATGAPAFTEAEAADLDAVAVDLIAAEVAKRNGLGGDDLGKAPRPTPS